MKQYWKRFISATPKALKKIQGLLVAISLGAGAAIVVMVQYDMQSNKWYSIFQNICIATAFAVPVLQFATSDKSIQDEK